MPSCNDNNNISICLRIFMVRHSAVGKSCAIDLRVAGSNPAGQLLIYFDNVFPVLTKALCRTSSLVPRSRIKAFVRKPRRCSPRRSPPPPPPDTRQRWSALPDTRQRWSALPVDLRTVELTGKLCIVGKGIYMNIFNKGEN